MDILQDRERLAECDRLWEFRRTAYLAWSVYLASCGVDREIAQAIQSDDVRPRAFPAMASGKVHRDPIAHH
jgi:hypothetical protein